MNDANATDINVGTKDTISRKAAIEDVKSWEAVDEREKHLQKDVIEWLKEFPPAQPERGKWIYHIDDLFPAESTMECNRCHAEQPLTCDDEFCPHCGADMREATE